jgi:D-arabinose 1-dehydrogenase-like Zn-dependent alcohol dehydrogenase
MENRGKKVRIKALKIRVPRPEVSGLIHAVGYGVTEWKEEQLVGVGWHGEHWPMQSCRCEDFFACCNEQMTELPLWRLCLL